MHGGDIYRNNIKYDFSVNINPLGAPDFLSGIYETAYKHMGEYPDIMCRKAIEAIADFLAVSKEWITFGNGASELIYCLCRTVPRSKKVLIVSPTFTEYEKAARAAGVVVSSYVMDEGHDFNINCVADEVTEHIDFETGIVFLCRPNNPVGELASVHTIHKILDRCRKTSAYLVVDECFVELSEANSLITFVKEYPNLVILRAFTKAFAIPALRIGYTVCLDDGLNQRLREQLPPWNISGPAQLVAESIKENKSAVALYLKKSKKLIAEEKMYLEKEIASVADIIYKSESCFVVFKCYVNLYKKLLEKGILIRICDDFEGLEKDCYRIAVKTHEENEVLVAAIKEITEEENG